MFYTTHLQHVDRSQVLGYRRYKILPGDKQSVSDSQSKKENAKAETLISEMEADLTEDGTKESHSDAPDEDLSIQKETMDKKSAEQEENGGGQEV